MCMHACTHVGLRMHPCMCMVYVALSRRSRAHTHHTRLACAPSLHACIHRYTNMHYVFTYTHTHPHAYTDDPNVLKQQVAMLQNEVYRFLPHVWYLVYVSVCMYFCIDGLCVQKFSHSHQQLLTRPVASSSIPAPAAIYSPAAPSAFSPVAAMPPTYTAAQPPNTAVLLDYGAPAAALMQPTAAPGLQPAVLPQVQYVV